MKNNKNQGWILVMVAVLNLGFVNTNDWQKSSAGILEPQINYTIVDPQDSNIIYAGTAKALYISKDQGEHYQPAAAIPGSEKGINYIYKSPDDSNIYVVTDSGVYASDDQGKSWQSIFNPTDPKARRSYSVLKDGYDLYVGTLGGLYHKYQNNPTWQREGGDLGNAPIYKIVTDSQYYYFANERRLFRKAKNNNELKIIFESNLNQNEEAPESNEEIFLPKRHIKDFVLVSSYLVIATNDGVSYSSDQGQSWNLLPVVGLPVSTITSLAVAQNSKFSHGGTASLEADLKGGFAIYAGTTKGVFQFIENRWTPLYKGMDVSSVQALTMNSEGSLYAATDRGLFFMTNEKTLASLVDGTSKTSEINSAYISKFTHSFDHEPTIQEVQRLAIDYAEVDPNKIKQWRRGAKYRAIMPNFSVGLDRDATEYFHWDSGPNPDNLLKGRDFMDWDLSLSWDLGDLIWNPDQTSIDSRSKLMVELREDIMDQVTRLYFERRRLAMEARMVPVSDPQSQLDQELRMAELTALIDALTGGKFSERIEKWQERRSF